MPYRTQLFQQLPWNGGLNTILDPALISPNQLTKCENVIFSVRGSRQKREGINYWDNICFAESKASSGTTRTLVMDAAAAGQLIIGDSISVMHQGAFNSNYDGKAFTVTGVSTTNVANDTITYTHPTSFTEATSTSGAIKIGKNEAGVSVVGQADFWRNAGSGAKERSTIGVFDDGRVYWYNNDGTRELIADSGTALSALDSVSFEIINNKLIFGSDAFGNVPKKITASGSTHTLDDLGGSPPNFSICEEHLSRLWTNDKNNSDRLHYSSTGNPEEWGGDGDSGAIDIGVGDGDPEGIQGIFPTFKGELFVAKKRRLYRVSGTSPENFKVEMVSDGIGCESHGAIVPFDQDDIMFISDRGFHSLAATSSFGDFSASFLSQDIQTTFNTFDELSAIQGVYLPNINSICFAVKPDGSNFNNQLWFYNIALKAWYLWPNIPCESVLARSEAVGKKLYMGTNNGRILTTQRNVYSDYGDQGILFKVKTGIVYPDNQVYTVKGFKKLVLLFSPKGNFEFTATVKIDNYPVQSLSFSQAGQSDTLGGSFVLGESLLGVNPVLAPVTLSLDGYGHGATLEITQTSAGQPIDIYGFGFEYEGAGVAQENIISEGSQ